MFFCFFKSVFNRNILQNVNFWLCIVKSGFYLLHNRDHSNMIIHTARSFSRQLWQDILGVTSMRSATLITSWNLIRSNCKYSFCTFILLRLDSNVSTKFFYYSFTNWQPKPAPFFVMLKIFTFTKVSKKFAHLFLRHSYSSVFNCKFYYFTHLIIF